MVKKAIIPMAGEGSRMQPISAYVPKELLPIGTTPIIQIIIEELIHANISEFIFITNPKKKELNLFVQKLFTEKYPTLKISFIDQKVPKGLGHAVKLTEEYVAEREFFLLALPDNLFNPNHINIISQMIHLKSKFKKSIISINHVPKEEAEKRAIVTLKNDQFNENGDNTILEILDKPKITAERKKNIYAISGRYILQGSIFTF
jgi:UTP--glucose-1-phosphate uridylyltransferase